MLKKVEQMFNQTPLLATVDNPNSNIASNKVPHDNSWNRQSTSTSNTTDIQKQTIPPQKDSYKLDSTNHIRTSPIKNFERTKQIIMAIDALSHSPELCNKILWELNLNGLCQYSKSHKAYIFEKSNCIVNCSYMLRF